MTFDYCVTPLTDKKDKVLASLYRIELMTIAASVQMARSCIGSLNLLFFVFFSFWISTGTS